MLKRIESERGEFLGQGDKHSRRLASDGAFDEAYILIEASDVAEPDLGTGAGYSQDVRKVARTQTTTDRQLNIPQQTTAAPFRL